MAFTTGTGTFTNGSTTVTNVSLSSGTLAYFASGTRMVVGANPVTAEVEAVAAPTVTTITLRSPWPHTGGTYDFLANQTSEGLRDAVQSIRTNNTTLQNYIDSISKAPNADTVIERTSTGAARVADGLNADEAVASGQFPDDVADLYAKNNILGAVSQTGGVPTGAIIERGSNANGEYVKYADGTLINFLSVTISMNTNSFQGYPYAHSYTNITGLVSSGAPSPDPSVLNGNSTYNWYQRLNQITCIRNNDPSIARVVFRENPLSIIDMQGPYHILTIGRWY